MKFLLLALMMLFIITQIAMAQGGGPSFEQLNKANHQGKIDVELIDKTSKGERKQICLLNEGKNKVKEKIC